MAHGLLTQFGRLGQVHRSQAFPSTVVDGHRGRRSDLEGALGLHPQRNPVAADAQHGPPVSLGVRRLFQPRQHPFRLELPTERCQALGQAGRHFTEFLRAPLHPVLAAQSRQDRFLRGPRFGQIPARDRGQRRTGPADQPQLPFQGKQHRFTPVTLPVAIPEPPQGDLSEKRGHVPVGRLAVESVDNRSLSTARRGAGFGDRRTPRGCSSMR